METWSVRLCARLSLHRVLPAFEDGEGTDAYNATTLNRNISISLELAMHVLRMLARSRMRSVLMVRRIYNDAFWVVSSLLGIVFESHALLLSDEPIIKPPQPMHG